MRRAVATLALVALLSLGWIRPALAHRGPHHGDRKPHKRHGHHRGQKRLRVVRIARKYLGVPYVWGGTSPRGFDCSGLVQFVYRRIGIHIGRTTFAQLGEGMRVRRGLRAGDVVFTRGGEHEGLYMGRGRVLHAPHTGDVVRITSLRYFLADGWAGARRFAT